MGKFQNYIFIPISYRLISLLLHVNWTTNSWSTAISKCDIQSPRYSLWVKGQCNIVDATPYQFKSHTLRTVHSWDIARDLERLEHVLIKEAKWSAIIQILVKYLACDSFKFGWRCVNINWIWLLFHKVYCHIHPLHKLDLIFTFQVISVSDGMWLHFIPYIWLPKVFPSNPYLTHHSNMAANNVARRLPNERFRKPIILQ